MKPKIKSHIEGVSDDFFLLDENTLARTCPKCQGEKQIVPEPQQFTLAEQGMKEVFDPITCPKCRGKGYINATNEAATSGMFLGLVISIILTLILFALSINRFQTNHPKLINDIIGTVIFGSISILLIYKLFVVDKQKRMRRVESIRQSLAEKSRLNITEKLQQTNPESDEELITLEKSQPAHDYFTDQEIKNG